MSGLLQIPTTPPLAGLTMVNDANAALAALAAKLQSTFASAPTTSSTGLSSMAGVEWHDTTNNVINIRDQADTAWITMGAINETLKTFTPWTNGDALAVAPPERQTVLSGSVDSTGLSNFVTAGAGLSCNLAATAVPVTLTFAAGFGPGGSVDLYGQIAADQAGYWSSLPANNTSYLSIDRNASTGSLTSTSTLAQPQYCYQYEQGHQALLQFGGSAGSSTFLDDNGNVWTAVGGAKVQTNSFKFGTGGLGGAGTLNALNGSADGIKTSAMPSIGMRGPWSMRAWFNPSALPGTAASVALMSAVNSAGVGALLFINNNAGTVRYGYNLSSDGSTNNVASVALGTSAPVVGQWDFVELTYDQTGGVYRLYVNGVQQQSTTSALRICNTPFVSVGFRSADNTIWFNGYVDKVEILPYCNHPGGTTYAVPTGAPSISAAGYAADWFDLGSYVMKSPSAASVAAGSNPTFSAKQRVYVGEAAAGAASVSSAIAYALQGAYVTPWVTPLPGTATTITKTHNLGCDQYAAKVEVQCLGTDDATAAGEIAEQLMSTNASYGQPMTPFKSRNTVQVETGQTSAWVLNNRSNGSVSALTVSSWQYRLRVKRDF